MNPFPQSHGKITTSRTKDSQIVPEGVTRADTAPHGQSMLLTTATEDDAKTILNMKQRARATGRAAVKKSIHFYLVMMIPISIVTVWMFALFAMVSWFVPQYLCEDVVQQLSGSALGIASCVFNQGGQYTPYKGAYVFWLLFWSVQVAWVALFPGFVCKAIFGSKMSRVQEFITIFVGIIAFVTPFIVGIVFHKSLNHFSVAIISSVGSLLVNITCSSAAVRYTGNHLMRWRWILLFLFAGQVNTFYLYIMPQLITARSQDALGGMGLTVIRLFVHPVIWAIVLFFFRTVMRHIGRVKDLTHICFLVWPVLYASLYGRFLLLQLDNVGSVVIMNFIFACFSISGELSDRGSDSWWLSWIYGERAKDAMQAVRDVDEMALVNQLTANMMEAASIVSASALLSFGRVATSPGVPPNNVLIWSNAAAQMATTLAFSYVEIVACGKFHNLEWRKVYPRSVVRFLCYVLIVLTVGGSRLCIELLKLFCPRQYDDGSILLEQCDRPSLFQAIHFTFAKRTGNTALGQWLDIGPANNSLLN